MFEVRISNSIQKNFLFDNSIQVWIQFHTCLDFGFWTKTKTRGHRPFTVFTGFFTVLTVYRFFEQKKIAMDSGLSKFFKISWVLIPKFKFYALIKLYSVESILSGSRTYPLVFISVHYKIIGHVYGLSSLSTTVLHVTVVQWNRKDFSLIRLLSFNCMIENWKLCKYSVVE